MNELKKYLITTSDVKTYLDNVLSSWPKIQTNMLHIQLTLSLRF
jgi:hypothetical protein